MLGNYWKFITALVLGVLGWAGVVVQSSESAITNAEWQQLIAVAVAAVGVFLVPNTQKQEN